MTVRYQILYRECSCEQTIPALRLVEELVVSQLCKYLHCDYRCLTAISKEWRDLI